MSLRGFTFRNFVQESTAISRHVEIQRLCFCAYDATWALPFARTGAWETPELSVPLTLVCGLTYFTA